jgi:ribosomal protein L32
VYLNDAWRVRKEVNRFYSLHISALNSSCSAADFGKICLTRPRHRHKAAFGPKACAAQSCRRRHRRALCRVCGDNVVSSNSCGEIKLPHISKQNCAKSSAAIQVRCRLETQDHCSIDRNTFFCILVLIFICPDDDCAGRRTSPTEPP